MNNQHVPGTQISLLSYPSKLSFPGWALPAKTTCMPGECHKYCYGVKGRFTFPNVKRAQQARYEWTKKCELYEDGFPHSRRRWREVMTDAITPYTHFRWHVNGDIYSPTYAKMIYGVCSDLKATKFWIPTRAWQNPDILSWLQLIAELPNCTVRPSADPGQRPHRIHGLHAGTTIDYDNRFQCPADSNLTGHCENCTICWDRKNLEISYKLKR